LRTKPAAAAAAAKVSNLPPPLIEKNVRVKANLTVSLRIICRQKRRMFCLPLTHMNVLFIIALNFGVNDNEEDPRRRIPEEKGGNAHKSLSAHTRECEGANAKFTTTTTVAAVAAAAVAVAVAAANITGKMRINGWVRTKKCGKSIQSMYNSIKARSVSNKACLHTSNIVKITKKKPFKIQSIN